ncbi:hypothetical protein T10_9707 [Trichinella papuae]|uniref:Uncharacterized protein n=1 Tax=Trichinella papuae TaxID=268474 RepID=A0A0V1M1P7_9BILA|nr:hypothetical protein T10_9707 [Trichinella papuae]
MVSNCFCNLRESQSSGTELPFWKAFKLDRSWRSRLPSLVVATQCNGPACNCYCVVGGCRARILFDSGSTISLICKNLDLQKPGIQ